MSEIEKTPSIGVSLQVPLANARQLVMQTFVDRECPAAELNALLDKLRGAADRQDAVAQLSVTQKLLADTEKQARDQDVRIAQVEANIAANWENGGRRGDPALSPKERDDMITAHKNAQTLKDNIARIKAEITKYEAIIGA